MNIPFSETQYRTLLNIVHLGEWLANARRTDEGIKDITAIEQYVYSFASAFGMDDLVTREGSEFVPTSELEDPLFPIIDAYDDEGFWDKLVEVLAARDLTAEHGITGIKKLDHDKLADQMDERAAVYEEEFEEYGVERLQIVEE
jgi:hypothetical protein